MQWLVQQGAEEETVVLNKDILLVDWKKNMVLLQLKMTMKKKNTAVTVVVEEEPGGVFPLFFFVFQWYDRK